ncbi:MBL fold metallo-hydrolase [Nocardiopsis suaedae]|uniref:MBL fold metallo-hydrolase n=1 Tax=Nocardiopsis suaedae TaxID=3018444 RepID=A0ABT4TSR8_9ACTN|nr:MBL fold metallo-hydrolase [Nocardiopsis suaedae]MDA2807728.1 MBL fold metallo-hydrolase [Nocardiopsis suaedae]
MIEHTGRPHRRAVVAVDLLQSTAYAVRGQRTVLVDAGPAGHEPRLLRGLARAGVDPAEVSLIVLTHCHPDHAGGAAELRRRLDVPVAVHAAEADWARNGTSVFYDALRPFGHVLRRTMRPTFPAFTPDIVLDGRTDLAHHGAPVTALHTPGHTPGSLSLLHHGEGDALVGDLLAGSMLRGDRPDAPFFAQSLTEIESSVRTVLAEGPRRLLFGHGHPASARSVRDRLARITHR